MVGLLPLKQLENLSNENVVWQWKRNPYHQYFRGFNVFQAALPCRATERVKFRQRIGTKGAEAIFAMRVALHGKDAQDGVPLEGKKQVIIDTTVQEKSVTYPTVRSIYC